MSAQWDVGAVVQYESKHGDALLLVLESWPDCLERVLVMWGDGEFRHDTGRSFIWSMSEGFARRIT